MSNEPESPFLTLHEFVKEAKSRLSPGNWDYLVGATETETTMLRNRAAIDAWAFRPRVLRDVSSIDVSGRFLGRKIELPVMLAPVKPDAGQCHLVARMTAAMMNAKPTRRFHAPRAERPGIDPPAR